QAPMPGEPGTTQTMQAVPQAATDEIPTDTPAGRAARLRKSERREKSAEDSEGPQLGDWAPEQRRRRWVKPVAGLAAVVIIIGGLGGGAYYWSQQQYYVASDNGQVAIYKGVSGSFAGVHLSHVYSKSPEVTVSTLPTANQDQVRSSISATNLSDAQSIVHTLSVLSADCTALTTVPDASAGAGALPSISSSPSASAHASGTPSGTGRTSPTAKATKTATTSTTGTATVTAAPPASPSASPSAGVADTSQLSAQCPAGSGDASATGTG
ncbi:MAG: hypothetical protein ACRDVE_14075, partial [Actinocrinis sp.]